MNRAQCSFHTRGGVQCPAAWMEWAWVLGKNRPVCSAHAHIASVEEGERVMEDMKMVQMQRQYEETGDAELGERLARIRQRADEKDRERATAVYALGRAQARNEGKDEAAAHIAGLMRLWKTARYPEGDPRRGDV